jgi:hypothetical protein
MKWVPKHLRESELRLERVQTKLMVIKLFTDVTYVVHLTIGFKIAHTGKSLWKCLRGNVQL